MLCLSSYRYLEASPRCDVKATSLHCSMGTVPRCLSEFVVYCLNVFAAFSGVSLSKSLLVCVTPGSDGNVSTEVLSQENVL